jgi:hypothetical protein
MVMHRRVLQIGAMTWAAVGLVVALWSLGAATPDAWAVVALASAAGPLAALLAAFALAHHKDRAAGLLLLVSVVTPTYFAWVLNVPALLAAAALVVAPRIMVGAPLPGAR